MFDNYTKDIEELKDQEWIHKIYKENVNKLVGYFIQFLDGSFIVGSVKKGCYEYTYVKKNSYISGLESQAELFVNFIDVRFSGELAKDSFLKELHNKFDSEIEKPVDEMSKVEIEAEMLLAAKIEDFEKAALLKRKLDEK